MSEHIQLVTLIEQCGSLIEIASQVMLAANDNTPASHMRARVKRLSDQMANVLATMAFVSARYGFDEETMQVFGKAKLDHFKQRIGKGE